MVSMKAFISVFILLVLCSFGFSEEMYTTFASKDTLSKSDVVLRLDEKEVAIDDFLRVDIASRSPEILSHPAVRRRYILLVDLLYLSPAEVLEVRKLVQIFVAQIPKDDLIALAAITNEDGLRFFSGLTTDRSKLIAGWNAMGQVVIPGMTEGPDGNLYSAEFSSDPVSVELLPDDSFLANIKAYSVSEKAKNDMAPLYIQSFVDLASLFSTMNGRKDLILFSPGTDVKGLSVDLSKKNEEATKQGESAEDQDHKTIGELTQLGPRDIEALAKNGPQTKHSRENDANVVSRLIEGSDGHVHVVHPSGEANDFLKGLADKTNGSYWNMSQFADSVRQILNSDSSFYVLGWQGAGEKDFHELHVMEIKSANTKIDGPTRWLAPKTPGEYTPLERKMRVSLAVYEDSGSPNQYRFWSDVSLDDGSNRISTFTEVPGVNLLTPKAKQASLEFYGFSINRDGQVEDFYSLPIALDLGNAKLKERLQKAGLKVWNVLFSGHGPVLVRTIVMNLQTGETVTNSTGIRFRDTDFLLSNPFLPSTNFDWIFWPKTDLALNRRGKEILYPYKLGSDIFAPELSPKVRTDEKGMVVYFKMYNFVAAKNYPSVQLRLIGENGASVDVEKFGLMQQPRLLQRGGLEVFWRIEAIPTLTKGNYRLQVDVTDRHQGKEVIRDVDVSVE